MEKFKAKATPLKQYIRELFQASVYSEQYLNAVLQLNWPKIAGKLVAKHTKQIKIKGNCVMIYTSNPTLKQELNLNKSAWLERIQSEFDYASITEIKVY